VNITRRSSLASIYCVFVLLFPRSVYRSLARRQPRQRLPLAGQAGRSARREIFPGFAATEILYEGNAVKGVATGDLGINRKNEKTAAYQPGMELHGK